MQANFTGMDFMGIPLKIRRERKMACRFTSSIKREIMHFHVWSNHAANGEEMYTKAWCTCKESYYYYITRLTFSFPSPSSLLKLPNASCPCGIPSSWYTPCDWSIVTIYFNIYVIHLFSSAQSLKKHVKQWKHRPFWRFDIWHFDTTNGFSVFSKWTG